jgi:hypothetical protein
MKAFRDFIEKYMKKSDYIDDQFVVGKGSHLSTFFGSTTTYLIDFSASLVR